MPDNDTESRREVQEYDLDRLREQINTVAKHRAESPNESWVINDVGGVVALLAERDRLVAEVERMYDAYTDGVRDGSVLAELRSGS